MKFRAGIQVKEPGFWWGPLLHFPISVLSRSRALQGCCPLNAAMGRGSFGRTSGGVQSPSPVGIQGTAFRECSWSAKHWYVKVLVKYLNRSIPWAASPVIVTTVHFVKLRTVGRRLLVPCWPGRCRPSQLQPCCVNAGPLVRRTS